MKKGICEKHGRIMLHNGKCHDCRNKEEREHKTDGTPCWCNPKIVKVRSKKEKIIKKNYQH